MREVWWQLVFGSTWGGSEQIKCCCGLEEYELRPWSLAWRYLWSCWPKWGAYSRDGLWGCTAPAWGTCVTWCQRGLQMKSYHGCLFPVHIMDSVIVVFEQQKHGRASCGHTQGAREGISNISNMYNISRKRMPNALAPLGTGGEMKQMLITTLQDGSSVRGLVFWAHRETQAEKAPSEILNLC